MLCVIDMTANHPVEAGHRNSMKECTVTCTPSSLSLPSMLRGPDSNCQQIMHIKPVRAAHLTNERSDGFQPVTGLLRGQGSGPNAVWKGNCSRDHNRMIQQ
jgi:hypothetical protein